MIRTGFILVCLPALVLCGSCQIFTSSYIFQCVEVTQDEFLYEIFKHQETVSRGIYSVIILDSNFETIDTFQDLLELLNMNIDTLVIRNSSVHNISDRAFSSLNLRKLDLSNNNLKSLQFIRTVRSNDYVDINLSGNYLEEVDLSYLDIFSAISSLDLSNNKLSSIFPASGDNVVRLVVDLSYNALTEFNETKLGTKFNNLDVSYNLLTEIEVSTFYNGKVLTTYGNNITTINSDGDLDIDQLYLSFLPKNKLTIRSTLSFANAFLGSLDNGSVLNIDNRYLFDFDLSNTSLTSISENYFRNLNLTTLNLSHNNFFILNRTYFPQSEIRSLDLSFSNIKYVTEEVFQNMSAFMNTLNLTGNLLEEVIDVCQTLSELRTLDFSLNKITKFDFKTFENCTSLEALNISKSLLSSVNFSRSSIQVLDLSENNINRIDGNISSLSNLKTLILKKNEISVLNSDVFANLDTLNIIDLSDNLIENIKERAFFNLKSLSTLNLKNNKLSLLGNNIFENLGVQNLLLQGNNIKFFSSQAFDNLFNLRVLNLSNIGLTAMENDVFYNLPNIQTIDLSNNNLFVLDNATFNNLPLSYLNLSGNRLEEIRSGAFGNLSNLKNLNLSDLRINKIEPGAFSNLKLEFVDLRNNNISGIEPKVFKSVTVNNLYLNEITEAVHLDNTVIITNLNLQFNGIMQEQTIANVFLKNLNFVDSRIDLMKNDCLLGNYGLTQLKFNNSNISGVEQGALNGLLNLENLDASDIFKNSTTLESNIFQDLNKLKVLNLSNTELTVIQDGAFSGLNNLQELHLVNNNLSSLNESVFKPLNSSLNFLDLSRNSLKFLNLSALTNSLMNLKILNVSSALVNELSVFNVNSTLNSIEELYLNNNSITSLTANTFRTFVKLTKLFLNNNSLSSIPYQAFNYSRMLQQLRLDSNKLQQLPVGVFDGIENLQSLNLSQNSQLFYSGYSTLLVSLNKLNSLYLDDTYLGKSFQYTQFNLFKNLNRLTLNNNLFTCSYLNEILNFLDSNKINYIPYNPRFDVQNINGIICSSSF